MANIRPTLLIRAKPALAADHMTDLRPTLGAQMDGERDLILHEIQRMTSDNGGPAWMALFTRATGIWRWFEPQPDDIGAFRRRRFV